MDSKKGKRSSFLLDIRELRKTFDEVDTENKGYIDFDGLRLMINGILGMDASMAPELMESLDRDNDGKVTFEDFQTLFTLQRDEVKQQLGREQESTDSAAYVTALGPSPDASPFSPNRPPVPPGQRSRLRGNKSPIMTVPASPDLTAHARSLKGSILHSPQLDIRRLSLSSHDSDIGDMLLEGIGLGPGDVPASPSLPMAGARFSQDCFNNAGLILIQKELQACCPTGLVNKDGMEKLCERLHYDQQDKQELLDLWQEMQNQSPNHVTIEMMCNVLAGATPAMVTTSTPAVQHTRTWKQDPPQLSELFGPPITLFGPTHHQLAVDSEAQPPTTEENKTSESLPDVSVSLNTASKEGSRLSRAPQIEASISRHVLQKLQHDLTQVSQERDSLKLNLSRVEDERRMLIKEGDEGFSRLMQEKDDKIMKLQEESRLRLRELENQFSTERIQLEERARRQLTALENNLKLVKSEEEKLKNDLLDCREQKEWLDKELDRVQEELSLKTSHIRQLQEANGGYSEENSEYNFTQQSARVQELERDLEAFSEQFQDLNEQNRELSDKVDELKSENEVLKQRVLEEKRKRQRKKSATTTKQSPSKGKHRHLPERGRRNSRGGIASYLEGLSTTMPEEDLGNENEERMVVVMDDSGGDAGVEEVASGSEPSEEASTFDSDDEMMARSSASLMEEMQVEVKRAAIGQKIDDLVNKRSLLEANCDDLKDQLQNLEENKVALRRQIEEDLKRKMYQKANLEKHIKKLNMLKQELANARRAFSSQLQESEQYLSEYMEGLETDMNDFISEDAKLGITQQENARQLSLRVKELEDELKASTEDIATLKENNSKLQMVLLETEKEKEALISTRNEELDRDNRAHEEEVQNLKIQLQRSAAALDELSSKLSADKEESERAISRLLAQVDVLEAEKTLMVAQHTQELQQQREALLSEGGQILQQTETENTDLRSSLMSLQESYSHLQEQSGSQVAALKQYQTHEKDLEAKLEGQEREMKTMKAELALAIHDLTAKEEECSDLQEKVEMVEGAFSRVQEFQDQQQLTIATLELQNQQLHEEIVQSNQLSAEQTNSFKVEKKSLQTRIQQLEEELNESKNMVLNSSLENDKLKSFHEDLQIDLSHKMEEIEVLKRQLEEKSNNFRENEVEETDEPMMSSPIREKPAEQVILFSEDQEYSIPPSPINSTNESSRGALSSSQDIAIVQQMKTQLEELQRILVSKGGEDSSISEISIIQELLITNKALEDMLRHSKLNERQNLSKILQAASDQPPTISDLAVILENIESLSSRITLLAKVIVNIRSAIEEQDAKHATTIDGLIDELNNTRDTLRSKEHDVDLLSEKLEDSKVMLDKSLNEAEEGRKWEKEVSELKHQRIEDEASAQLMVKEAQAKINEAQKKILAQEQIIQRQKQEMETLNFELGKAKSIQHQYDDTQHDTSIQLQEKDKLIMTQTQEIQQLREDARKAHVTSTEYDELDRTFKTHQAELLMQQESIQAAEEVITKLRSELNDLYQYLVNPSDSSAYDVLEDSELIKVIRSKVEELKNSVPELQARAENAEKMLEQNANDYDNLYCEHEEEVRAICQQKQQVELLLKDAEERYQMAIRSHEAQVTKQKNTECQVEDLTAENTRLMQYMRSREEEVEGVHMQLSNLQQQKRVLVNLIQTLGMQAIQGFTAIP